MTAADVIFELWYGPDGSLCIVTGERAREVARRGEPWRQVAAVRASDLMVAGIDAQTLEQARRDDGARAAGPEPRPTQRWAAGEATR